MLDKLFDLLLNDPIKFSLATLTLGLFYLFKKYDSRIDKSLDLHANRMLDLTKHIDKTGKEIREVKNEFSSDTKDLKQSIHLLKSEIQKTKEELHQEITRVVELTNSKSFASRLAFYDEQLEKLKDNFGKVILLENDIEKCKAQDEIQYKMFLKVADRLNELKAKK
jgi:archaellum component FlaC